MALALSLASRRLAAKTTQVATAIGSGTTAAEVHALAQFLLVCSQRPDLTVQLMKLAATQTSALTPG